MAHHRTLKFLQNFEPHPLPLFLNDRRALHERLRLRSLRLHHLLPSRPKVLFGLQLGMVGLLEVDHMRWERVLQRDLVPLDLK